MKYIMIVLCVVGLLFAESFTVDRVVRVYDGDTFFANLRGEDSFFAENIKIRIAGIDTPEKITTDSEEKTLALEVRDYVKGVLANAHTIELRNCVVDDFIVADVYINGTISLADLILENSYACRYEQKRGRLNCLPLFSLVCVV